MLDCKGVVGSFKLYKVLLKTLLTKNLLSNIVDDKQDAYT